jgi:hypothetical protein
METTKLPFKAGPVWRSLAPSGTSGTLCMLAGIATVTIGVLVAATKQGTPVTNSGVNLSATTGLDTLLSRGSWHDLLTLITFTVVLVVIMGATEFLFGSFAGKQHTREVAMKSGQATSAERHWLLTRARFRLAVGLVTIIVAVILIDLVHWASAAERAQVTFLQLSLTSAAWRMAIASIVWALTYHTVLVFIRLYTFRTRIFGTKELY